MFNGGFANGHGGGGFNRGWGAGGFNGGNFGRFNGGQFGAGWNGPDFAKSTAGTMRASVDNMARTYHQLQDKARELEHKALNAPHKSKENIEGLVQAKHYYEQEAALRNKANWEASLHGVLRCQKHEKAASHAQQDANAVRRYLNDHIWQ